MYHWLYGFYYLGYSRKELAHVYHKSVRTILNWIQVYEETGTFERAQTTTPIKFNDAH